MQVESNARERGTVKGDFMTEYNRKAVKAIFENAGIEIPPKDVLTDLCELHQQNTSEKDERIKELETNLAAAEQERDSLKEENGDGFKKKYEDTKKAFDDYKKSVTDKEAQAARETAARAYFESKKITGANLEIAMRAATAEISALELDGDKIKDTATLDALTTGTLSGLVKQSVTVGADIAHPPTNTGSGTATTKESIMKIKDVEERQKAIANHLDLFKRGV